jgi:hypothetical protein
MARKQVDVTITDDGRDKGHTFRITEMPARAAEKWAARLLLALVRNGAVTEDVVSSGMAGLAAMAARSIVRGFGLIDFDREIEPLLDEMLSCVTFVPDPRNPALPARALLPEEPEEVATLYRLRTEWVALHLGFTSGADLSTWITRSAPAAMGSPSTSTSP